jgi:2-isopropylmalate synthase
VEQAGGRDPRRFFRVESWRAITEDRPDGTHANEATVKLWAKGERIVATAEGNGPVNALDRALRVGLEQTYPQLAGFALVDYKVRILEGRSGTDSTTRVLITTTDGSAEWSTVGVADNVIAASWQALDDAYAYGLLRAGLEPQE